MTTDPIRMCELLVGLPDVNVLTVEATIPLRAATRRLRSQDVLGARMGAPPTSMAIDELGHRRHVEGTRAWYSTVTPMSAAAAFTPLAAIDQNESEDWPCETTTNR